jgi:hypothetical protein
MHKLWYVIAVLAVLVGVTILVRGRQEPPVVLESASPTPVMTPEPTPTPTPKRTVRRRTPTPVPTPSYNEVAEQYASNRIQFDVYCHVFPEESTFLVGTEVMLDNRSPDDRVVSIGSEEHGLRSYGWKVVTMTAPELPATLAIGCGGSRNVGKITVDPLPTPSPEPLPTPASPSDPLASASASPSLEPSP